MKKVPGIVFSRPEHAELHHGIQLPAWDESSILVKTMFSTISRGTELDLYTAQMHGKGKNTQWYPILPGYMPVGVVEKAGSAIHHLREGDRVLGSNLFNGFDERYCAAWAGHLAWLVFNSTSHPWLGAQRAVKIPADVAAEEAGLAMLAAVAWNGVKMKIDPRPGEIILVIGQGVIGNFAAQLCQMRGATVLAVDKHQENIAVSQRNGISRAAQTDGQPLDELIPAHFGVQEVDAVIEVTGENQPLLQASRITKRYGKIHAQGMYLEDTPREILRILFDRNLTLSATVGETPELTRECLEFFSAGALTVKGMIGMKTCPDNAGDAYRDLAAHNVDGLTCIFDWSKI